MADTYQRSSLMLCCHNVCVCVACMCVCVCTQAASGTTPRGLPPVASVSCLTSSLAAASQPVCTDASGQDLSSAFCLSPLPRTAPRSSSSHTATATQCVLTPEDLRPLTRVPLMIVVDGDVAHTLRR